MCGVPLKAFLWDAKKRAMTDMERKNIPWIHPQRVLPPLPLLVNLLKEDQSTCLPLQRLIDLLDFIYSELNKKGLLGNYRIFFDVNFASVQRTVIYDNLIFGLNISEEVIFLQPPQSIDKLANEWRVDDTIGDIIHAFHEKAA